uniref:Putative thrombospondin n=1 Tax=Ixodes ricinus TaxID=34613 RepID=A0A6B0UQ29_IXORI
MQLALFVVIVAFVHLSCELQSVSCWYVDESLKNIGGECENQLLEEVLNKCSEQGGGFTRKTWSARQTDRLQCFNLGGPVPEDCANLQSRDMMLSFYARAFETLTHYRLHCAGVVGEGRSPTTVF